MNITHLSASDYHGGASIAARRVFYAVNKFSSSTDNIKLLVRQSRHNNPSKEIIIIPQFKFWLSSVLHPRYLIEKIVFLLFERSKKTRFLFSTNLLGFHIRSLPIIQNSDIVQLHWVNNSTISLKEIGKMMQSDKPIIWTLHDMWAFTGGCHYTYDCNGYLHSCGNCPLLKRPKKNDLSNQLWQEKNKIYKNAKLTIVTSSNWLAEKVKKSSLLGSNVILTIPTPIDQTVFFPKDKKWVRQKLNLPVDKILLLFGAVNLNDPRKGINFLIDALQKIQTASKELSYQIELVLVGNEKASPIRIQGFTIHRLGSIQSESAMSEIYSASDCYVLPSLEDNLPNTIIESLSCGTPVVAFSSGGIPEMIQHKRTGYLAQPQSSDELMNGIIWMMDPNNREVCSENAVRFVNENYSEKIVAEKYFALYKDVLGLS